MTKLIVMLILISPRGGPTAISVRRLDACNAAKASVKSAFKSEHGGSSYINVDTNCVEFPNK